MLTGFKFSDQSCNISFK